MSRILATTIAKNGFHALNVHAICDREQRFLWCSTGHKGGTHDNRAFFETCLYDLFDKMAEDLLAETEILSSWG